MKDIKKGNMGKKNLILVLLLMITLLMTNPNTTIYANDANEKAYWNFDETTGTLAKDTWGDNNGTLTGGQWISEGKVGGALAFDGDDYITIGKADITSPWSVAAWVKYDKASTNNAVLLSSNQTAIKIEQWDNLGKVGYTQYGVADYAFNYSLPVNEWTHLTFVGDTSGVKLYVNGQYTDSHNAAVNCPMSYIGTGKNHDVGHIQGALDELKIYTKVLTPAEIAGLAGVPYDRLSRASKVLIDKGMQLQAWVTTDETNRYDLSPEDWDMINFTSPTYYEAPMYNSDLHTARPNLQWSLAKAPYYNQLTGPPANNDHFLSNEQRGNLDNLVSMCFGDEENYSSMHVSNLKAWYDLSKTLYPNVLVHNNQWSGQWSESNLRYYIQQAKPDLLTFDTYHFDENVTPGYEFIRHCANSLGLYRQLALEGYDGTGESPIAFGQYLLGYITGSAPHQTGSYRISESQVNMIPFTTVTMGGKWLNFFRWLQDSAEFGLLYDANGQKTNQFYYYANMAKEIGNLGDHLVRLKSTNVYMVSGQHAVNNQPVSNALPSRVSAWNTSVDQYITDITVENMGQVNSGLAGDVMVGYFEPLQGLTDAMKAGVFTSDNPQYFMVMNGLVNDDGLNTAEKDKGSCDDSKQRITVRLDLGVRDANSLKRVSRQTGQVESVTLTPISGTIYELQLELGGGKADLFFWE